MNNKLRLNFIGLDDSYFYIDIEGDFSKINEKTSLFLDILSPLPELVWHPDIRKIDNVLLDKIENAINRFEDINFIKLKQKISSEKNGDFFFVIIKESITQEDKIEYERLLSYLNKDWSLIEAFEIGVTKFNELFKNYALIYPRMDKKSPKIGVKGKCRFCNNTKESGATFKKVAHIIPASLGNKYLKTLEECDSCNHYFGSIIEPHLINYISLYRNIWNVSSRDSRSLKTSLKNGAMYRLETKEGNNLMVIESIQEINNLNNLEIKIPNISLQNVYKSLCKIVINILPTEELEYLKDTIRWIGNNDDERQYELPLVMNSFIYSYSNFQIYKGATKEESIETAALIKAYVRKNEDSTLPHVVGEFVIGAFYCVFALPFSRKDIINNDVLKSNKFKELFRMYKITNWIYSDFSDLQPKTMTIKLNFKKNENS